MSSDQNVHREQFYLKVNSMKKANSRLISREDLLRAKEYILIKNSAADATNAAEQTQNPVSSFSKSFKKRINRNKFKLVNMGAEQNVVCIVTDEVNADDSNKASSWRLEFLLFDVSVVLWCGVVMSGS